MYIVRDFVVKSVVIMFFLLISGVAMEPLSKDESFIISEEKMGDFQSFDESLRREIQSHMINCKVIFNPLGIEKVRKFLDALKELTNQGILFRADNQDFKDDLFELWANYEKLGFIISPISSMACVNENLIEILKNYEEMLSANIKAKINVHTACLITRQIYCLEIIKWESVEYFQTMKSNVLNVDDLMKKSPESVQTQIDVQKLLYNFLTDYKDLMKEIGLERMSYSLMLKKVCLTSKDIRFEGILDDFPTLIEGYKEIFYDIVKEKQKNVEENDRTTEEASSVSMEVNLSPLPNLPSNQNLKRDRIHMLSPSSGRSSPRSQSTSPKSKKPWWK